MSVIDHRATRQPDAPVGSPGVPSTSRGATARFAYLDNARYWAMLLVVVGHALTRFTDNQTALALYVWIYAFHMPLFILLSGYLARRYDGSDRQMRRMISTLVVPYLLVETSLQVLMRHWTGEPDPLMLLSPQWLAWFLAALFVWRLSTPLWLTLRHPILVSIAISLTVGLTEVPNVLALPKILGLLPFWVIGLHLNEAFFERLRDVRIRSTALITLALTLTASFAWSTQWDNATSWLLWKQRYDENPLDASAMEGITQRGALLALGLILSLAVLALVPHGRSWTSQMGTRTLYAYLLHGYVILVLDHQFGLFEWGSKFGGLAVITAMAAAVLLANLLMTAVVARMFRPILEPRLTWLLRPERARTR